MRFRRICAFVLPAILIASMACGTESPTGIVEGELMTVGEQVVIEAALNKLADSAEVRGRTAQDTLMATFVRIAARLVLLQGRQGSIVVSNPLVAAAPITMKGAAFIGVDASAAGLPNVHMLVAWEGLDDLHATIQRALIVMADDVQYSGSFSLAAASTTDAARYMDFNTGGGFFFNVSGTLTVESPEFSGGCGGLPNSGGFTCEVGRERVGGSIVMSKDNGATRPSLSITSATLPAFRLVASTLSFPQSTAGRD